MHTHKNIDNAASFSKKEPKNLTMHQNFYIKEEKRNKKTWFDKDLQALKKKQINCPI